MDAIAALAQQAGEVSVASSRLEKQAKVGLGKFIAPLIGKTAKSTGKFQLSPLRAGLTGTAGLLGGKDLYSAARGGWSGEGNLDFHRERMQGLDYGPQGNTMVGLGRSIASPLKSLAALGWGKSGRTDYLTSHTPWQTGEVDPKTGMQTQTRQEVRGAYSPKAMGSKAVFDEAQKNLDQRVGHANARIAQIDKQIEEITSGSTGQFGIRGAQGEGLGDARAMYDLYQLQVERKKLTDAISSGTLGGKDYLAPKAEWYQKGPWAPKSPYGPGPISDYRNTMDSQREYLKSIGLLPGDEETPPAGGTRPNPLPHNFDYYSGV